MRICIDVSAAVHERAGLGRYTSELVAALLALDHNADYVMFYNNPASATIPPPLTSLPRLTTSLAIKPWRMAVLLSHMAGRSQDSLFPGIDLFHATDHLLPRLYCVKSVFTLHDLVFQVYPETHKSLNRWFLRLMIPRFLRAADAIIAISQWTKSDAVRLYGIPEEKITVIYEGVHPRFHRLHQTEIAAARQKYRLPQHAILYVGTIEPRKNLITLLDAYVQMLRQHAVADDTKLVIVGRKGWLYEPFFRRLHELGLEGQVIFPGFVADKDLPAIYAAADVFVFPSLYEGFGLPVLEAMACGAPVVCSNSSSLPEVAGDAALQFAPTDVASLAAALQRILSDGELRRRLVAAGVQRAQHFTWEETARQTLQVYRQVCNE